MPIRPLIRVLAVSFLLAGFARAQVTIAQRPLVGPFATIQAGIDAALEGESLLVVPGSYAPFTIDGKSAQVFVRGTGFATITGKVSVSNLSAAQFVVLSRLAVTSPPFNTVVTLDITGIAGHLRVQDSSFNGSGAYGVLPFYVGQPAVRVTSSVNVVFSSCTMTGGYGESAPNYFPSDGGPGLDSVNSSIALYDCALRGGFGSYTTDPRGGHGGAGYRGGSYGLFASGCSFTGGGGGNGDWPSYCVGGHGGDALSVSAAQAHLLDNTYVAGPGGYGQDGNGPPAASGGTIVALNGSIIDPMAGTNRRISVNSVNMDDDVVPITITGQPGDSVYLIVGRRPSFVFKKPLHGTWMVPTPFLSSSVPAGTIGPSGTLVLNRTFDIPDGTVAARLVWLQAFCIDTGGQVTLTGPAHVLSLE